MNISIPSAGQVNAFGRHAITSASSVMAVLAAFHFMKPEDVQAVLDALSQINDGVMKIVAGVGVLIPIGMAFIAALTASTGWQLLSVAKAPATPPEVKQAIAATVPAAAPDAGK